MLILLNIQCSILDILTTQFRQLNLKDEKKGNVLPSNYNYCSLFLKKLTIVVRHFAFLVIIGVLYELTAGCTAYVLHTEQGEGGIRGLLCILALPKSFATAHKVRQESPKTQNA